MKYSMDNNLLLPCIQITYRFRIRAIREMVAKVWAGRQYVFSRNYSHLPQELPDSALSVIPGCTEYSASADF